VKRIRIIRGVVGEHSVDWLPGDIVAPEDPKFAEYLVTRGKAVWVDVDTASTPAESPRPPVSTDVPAVSIRKTRRR
jgi:hypothetical protein